MPRELMASQQLDERRIDQSEIPHINELPKLFDRDLRALEQTGERAMEVLRAAEGLRLEDAKHAKFEDAARDAADDKREKLDDTPWRKRGEREKLRGRIDDFEREVASRQQQRAEIRGRLEPLEREAQAGRYDDRVKVGIAAGEELQRRSRELAEDRLVREPQQLERDRDTGRGL